MGRGAARHRSGDMQELTNRSTARLVRLAAMNVGLALTLALGAAACDGGTKPNATIATASSSSSRPSTYGTTGDDHDRRTDHDHVNHHDADDND